MKEVIQLLPDRDEVCFLIKQAFSHAFCEEVIRAHRHGFLSALSHYPSSYRNNERQIIDDDTFADSLFSQIQLYVPKIIESKGISKEEHGTWRLLELNDRIRICRYLPDQYFNKHLDGIYYKSQAVHSKLTFMVYLNDSSEFSGGRTLFFNSKEDDEIIESYEASKGDLIIFDHNLWHSGEPVIAGEKYILRSDILYERISKREKSEVIPFGEGHLGYIWKIMRFEEKIFTCGRDKHIKVWTTEGALIQELEGHDQSILSMIVIDDDTLISCSRDQTIRFWNESSGRFELEQVCELDSGTILDLCDLGQSRFCACSADGQLRMIDKTGTVLHAISAHKDWIWGIKQLDEKVIASIGEDGFLRVWELPLGRLVCEKKYGFPITAIDIFEQDRSIYLGSMDGWIIHLRFDEHFQVIEMGQVRGHSDKIWVIKADEKKLISGGEDNRLVVYSKQHMRKENEYLHGNFVQDLLLEDNRIISVSYDGRIRVID